MTTVRDRMWLWGHEAGSHDTGWDISRSSRITPVEAAFYMDVPNMIMVRYHDKPEMPFDQYADAIPGVEAGLLVGGWRRRTFFGRGTQARAGTGGA